MKVVLINALCTGGSTGRICEELSEWLNLRGHSCNILYGVGNVAITNSIRISSNVEIRVNSILARIFGKDASFSYISTYRIIKYLKQEKPDIVHLHNLHSNYVNLKLLLRYLAKSNIVTVLTLHDCWFFTGKCTHYTESGCYRWKERCGHCPRLKNDIPSFFFDKTESLLEEKRQAFSSMKNLGVIGVSDWIVSQAKESILKDICYFRRIYNWIDLDVFRPRNTEKWHNKFFDLKNKTKILCISGEWNCKSVRFHDLIHLSRKISDDFVILLAGTCEKISELPSNICYLGYISNINHLAELYSYADIYVHLSHEDTFGKVIAEAMACGTPAIVYNSTALPELIAEGRGFLVEKGDINGVVRCLEKFKSIGKKIFSLKCIDFVTRNFKKEYLLEQTESFYKMLCQNQ